MTTTMRSARSAAVLTAGLVLAAGCAPGDDPDPGVEIEDDGALEDGALDDDGPDLDAPDGDGFDVTEDADEQAGDDLADADGVLLTVMPACAAIGDELEITAEGLDPQTEHALMIEPEPSETGAFEPGTIAVTDEDGMVAVDVTLTEDAGIVTGDYEVELRTASEGEAGTWLMSAPLQIVEDVADCDL